MGNVCLGEWVGQSKEQQPAFNQNQHVSQLLSASSRSRPPGALGTNQR